jgi:hypothetical protein
MRIARPDEWQLRWRLNFAAKAADFQFIEEGL